MDAFDARPVSIGEGTEEEVGVRAYALGAVGMARELALGVVRETRAKAPANAMRLARHLFEHSIDLDYLIQYPTDGTRQIEAWRAKSSLAVNKDELIALPPLSPEVERDLKRRVKDAHRLDGKARMRERDGEVVPAPGWGFPNWEQKAAAVSRAEDYRFYYGLASGIAHPGVGSVGSHLVAAEGGSAVRLRVSGSDPTLLPSAPALALDCLVKIIEMADGCLGPVGSVSERVRVLLADYLPGDAEAAED